MKRLLHTIILIIICPLLHAQESETNERVKEVGITFNNLNSFGLTYRIGKSTNMWRFSTAFLSGGQSDIFGSINGSGGFNRNLGFGLQVGKEFRRPINDRFEFRSGTDARFQFNRFENKSTTSAIDPTGQRQKTDNFAIGVNLVLGVNYALKNNLIIGAELQPFISYNETTSEQENKFFNGTVLVTETVENSTTSYNYGINNQGVLLSIVYRY